MPNFFSFYEDTKKTTKDKYFCRFFFCYFVAMKYKSKLCGVILSIM